MQINQKQFPHKLANVLESASLGGNDENMLNYELGSDRLAKAIYDIGKSAMLVPREPKHRESRR